MAKKISSLAQETAGIAFAAGKSGGHLIPALTLAKEYRQKKGLGPIIFFTSNSTLDTAIMQDNASFMHVVLPCGSLPRSFFAFFLFIYTFLKSIWISYKTLRHKNVRKLITTGGFVAIPACCAAWLARIPFEVYELNAEPGRAVYALAPFAHTVYSCFSLNKKNFSAKKFKYAPYPLRFTERDYMTRQEACVRLGLDQSLKTIVIFGGSQGSQFVNELVQAWLASEPAWHNKLQIIHQTGEKQLKEVVSFYQIHSIKHLVFAYRSDIASCYAAADVIISRAGAGSLFENVFFKKSCIVIPLMTRATQHQVINAQQMARMYPSSIQVLLQSDIVQNRRCFDKAIKKALF